MEEQFDIRDYKPTGKERDFENALRPLQFGDFSGQDKVVDNLRIFVKAARLRAEALDHDQLHGPPGLGKTTLSNIIANELGVGFKVTSGPVLDKPGDLAGVLTSLEPNDVLFIDEIHRLSPVVEEYLYSAMEDYRIDIMIDKGPSARSIQLDLNPFTLVGATTRSGLLTAPLRARFGINLHLEYYDDVVLSRIILRSASILGMPVREKEGLAQTTGCVYGSVPEELEIREHDARMLVSIRNGQKTGHFLDQQENRGRIRPYCAGRTALDLCCCTGGFSIHAALYGAKSVEAVDVSEEALALVRKNAALNGVADKITTTCANVFDLAREYSDAGRQYGLVICDPPAFAKSKNALEGAYRGYKELNLRCMKLVEAGGFLVSCSCSQFMTPELFLKMLREAAADSGRTVRLIETLMQSRDHPAELVCRFCIRTVGSSFR